MALKITRREWAAAFSAATALAQQPAPPLPQNPDEELKASREQTHQASALLTKFEVPMATEPACHFKA